MKYRVWDNEFKRFVQDEDDFFIGADGDLVIIDTFGSLKRCGTDRFAVERFTGLLDKNGKEIYEGDVVEFEHGGLVRAYVIYKDGSFEAKNDKADVLLYLYVIDHKAEVIGNIHDNPELLEVSE